MAIKPLEGVPAKLRDGYIELAAAFQEHWQSVSALRDRSGIIGDNARIFLGATSKIRRRMAERWYGRDHARKMALRTTEEWLESLRPMLNGYVAHVVKESGDGDIRDEFFDAATYPYFIWTMPSAGNVGTFVKRSPAGSRRLFRRILLDCYFQPFPCLAIDDIYERTASGFSTGGTFGILRTTGEPFDDDLQLVIQGIFADFKFGWQQSGPEDSWQLQILDEHHYGDSASEAALWNCLGWPCDGRTVFAQVQQIEADDWLDMCWDATESIEDTEAYFPGLDVRELLRETAMHDTKRQKSPRAAKRTSKRKVR